ncbi:DNA polymerase IV [Clostridiales bacterium]|nr:DNA polymerase IV [Clostridiales bacterium]
MDRIILHSDLNNFYASVECLYDPSIRNKPVAVVGDIEKRHGIVLAKNYLAKDCGVKTGSALWEAKELCPDIVFVPPSYDRYISYSKMAKEIYMDYTDQVESFGLDECWLDVTQSLNIFGSGRKIADTIRERIKRELGVTVSIGVSFNKVFAKLCSDIKKPDATVEVMRDSYRSKIWVLPVEALLYVGRATRKKLNKLGIYTIGGLAKADIKILKRELGVNGIMLWRFANGLDLSPVAYINTLPEIKSVGNSMTLPYDISNDDDIRITLYTLAESVAERLRKCGCVCGTVQISLRDRNLYYFERQGQLQFETNSSEEIFKKSMELYRVNRPAEPLRSLGIRCCNLDVIGARQLSCLKEFKDMEKRERAERAIDDIRRRFGHFSVQRGIMQTNTALSAVNLNEDHVMCR